MDVLKDQTKHSILSNMNILLPEVDNRKSLGRFTPKKHFRVSTLSDGGIETAFIIEIETNFKML